MIRRTAPLRLGERVLDATDGAGVIDALARLNGTTYAFVIFDKGYRSSSPVRDLTRETAPRLIRRTRLS